jgi:hypothetical protein
MEPWGKPRADDTGGQDSELRDTVHDASKAVMGIRMALAPVRLGPPR